MYITVSLKLRNPLCSKSDKHQISPCNNNVILRQTVTRIKDVITQSELLLDIMTNSPHFFYRKCIGAANEN